MNQGNDSYTIQWRQWQDDCQALGVSVSEVQRTQFERVYEHLIEANRTVNLTRITAPEEFLYRHLLDSLTLSPLIPPNARLADIGSGAGFPSIPLAIARPDVTVTAVESIGKKCKFIQDTKDKLELANLSVLNARSEDLSRKAESRETFDVVTARAVAALPTLLELCLPLVRPGGLFLAMKGLSYEEELNASAKALKTLGGRFKEVQSFPHPRLEGSRLLVIEKVARTPDAYPRSAGLPGKKPL